MEAFELFMNSRRLRHLRRCNNFPTINQTDVAQHSYFTTMLAMLFADEVSLNEYHLEEKMNGFVVYCNINTEYLLRKCLLHDFEEAFTSDIPYPVKHFSEEVHYSLETSINDIMKHMTKDDKVSSVWNNIRLNCKNDVEGSIVSFCDMLELSIYCYEELCIGNKSFEVLLDNCNKYLDVLLNEVLMSLYKNNLSYFEVTGAIDVLIPNIWKIRQIVRKDKISGEYILQDFTVDI